MGEEDGCPLLSQSLISLHSISPSLSISLSPSLSLSLTLFLFSVEEAGLQRENKRLERVIEKMRCVHVY